jgi:hypothetical protein
MTKKSNGHKTRKYAPVFTIGIEDEMIFIGHGGMCIKTVYFGSPKMARLFVRSLRAKKVRVIS